MNEWLLAATVIAVVAVVFLIVSIVVSIFVVKGIVGQLNNTLKRIQNEQVQPLLTQTINLNGTINNLMSDIEYKKQEIDYVVQSVKSTNQQLTELNDFTRQKTRAIADKVNSDPIRQAQTEQWTNKALGFLNRKAQ